MLYSYYSTYGHVLRLAEEIQKGAASVEGVEAKLWQVQRNYDSPFFTVLHSSFLVNIDCEIPHRLERGTSASEDAGPRREVDYEIPHRLERELSILYKGVETSPY